MIEQPKFKSCFHVETIESVGVFLLSELDYFVLTGHLYELVAPLIDGQRSSDDIADLLRDRASPAEVYYVLMLLEKKGYIVEADKSLPDEIAAFWDSLKVERGEAKSRLQAVKVFVTSFGNVKPEPFITALETLKIQAFQCNSQDIAWEMDAEASDPEPRLIVALTDDYLQEGLETFNKLALQFQRPWLLIKPVGNVLWLGPLFQPYQTACWQCLAQRLQANRPVETFIQKQQGSSKPFPTSISVLPSIVQVGLNLAATEIAKWILKGNNQALENCLTTLDAIAFKTTTHPLVKRPQCPACGDPKYSNPQEPTPIILQSRKKGFTADGGHRIISPEETVKRYEHHISPITGAVRGVKPIVLPSDSTVPATNLTPTYVAGHNFAAMFDNLYFLRENLRGRSGGKGKTDIQAKASALCEAIERYSGIYQGTEIRRKGSYRDLRDLAIHPNTCMTFSRDQYDGREAWNATCPNTFQRVPAPFDETEEIEWTPVWSLSHKTFKYLPTAYCYYGYPKSDDPSCWADSNGTAAGNTREEAILQGFMELVERDSVAVWWYNRLNRPAVDLESFGDPYMSDLKAYYRSIHRDLWVLDLTADFGIPVFAAISRRTDNAVEDITYAFGAHFDPKIGILRSLTEVNQMLPAVLCQNPDGTTRYNFSDDLAMKWWQTATLENQPYLLPSDQLAPKTAADYPIMASDDLFTDVMKCIEIVTSQGLEMLVLEQTQPDIGLNVMKVIVPGMRSFWKRWGPGRLYDVPVKLGWLPAPLKEEELNPFPIFF